MKPIPAAPAMTWDPRIVIDSWCSVSCVCVRCINLDIKLDYPFTARFIAPDVMRVLREAA